MELYLVTTMIVDEPLSASTDGRGGYQPAGRSETKQYSSLCSLFYFGDNLMCLPGLVRSSKPGEWEKTASLATRFFPSTSTVTMRPAGGYKINWTSETDHTGTVARETTLNRWGQEHEKDALKKLEQILGVQVPSYSHNYIVVVVISRLWILISLWDFA